MNIDKDIKILEELAEDTIRYKMVETDAYMAGAITRVLKELETKDKIIDCMANKFYELYKIYPRNNRQIF